MHVYVCVLCMYMFVSESYVCRYMFVSVSYMHPCMCMYTHTHTHTHTHTQELERKQAVRGGVASADTSTSARPPP
jgi:hypothetical protein